MPCNSGVGLTPTIDGKVYHFGVCGLANGLAVMADEETRSYWDHITGECFHGPMKGHKLDIWPIQLTTVKAALVEHPEAKVALSDFRSAASSLFGFIANKLLGAKAISGKGFIPPPFNATMHAEVDSRLPRLENGLGVTISDKARFYPMRKVPAEGIREEWEGRVLIIKKGELDHVPVARWEDTGEKPMQLLTRWYGFSFTFPHCDIWEQDS